VAYLDLVLLLIAVLIVLSMIYLATLGKRNGIIGGTLARKSVHISIGILVIFVPLLFTDRIYPVIIGVVAIAFTYFTSPASPKVSWRLSAFESGNDLGTVYYSISLTLLLFFFFDNGWIIQVAFLPLVFGDAFANIIGTRKGKTTWPNSQKTIEGSVAGGIASSLTVLVVLSFYLLAGYFPGTMSLILMISLGVALLMPIVEVLSPFGLDNLTIPMICLLFALMVNQQLSPSCEVLYCFS
jgi:phytol kinase